MVTGIEFSPPSLRGPWAEPQGPDLGAPSQSPTAAEVRGRASAALLRRYRTLAIGIDFVAGAIAAGAATLLRLGPAPNSAYVAVTLAAPVLWVLAVAARRGYESRFLGAGPEEYRNIADAT